MKLWSTIFWLLLAVLTIVALLHAGDIEKVFLLLRSLQWPWLLAAGVAQLLTYVTTALALQGLLAVLDVRLSWRGLWRPTVAFVLGWQTVPTAGVGGLVLWTVGLRPMGVSNDAALASGILYSVLDYLSFFLLLAIGVLVMLVEHSLPLALLTSLVLMSVAILVTAGSLAALLSREDRGLVLLDRGVGAVTIVFGWLGRAPLNSVSIGAVASRFYARWRTLELRWHRLVIPTLWILGARLLDVMTLQVLFIAAGYRMAWGALTLGFVYANFASAVSLLPTGLGLLDASLALLFAGFGAPLATSVVVTLLFRTLAYWLPIPYGLYVYRRITLGTAERRKSDS